MSASVEMPKYRCHKQVHALKIRDLRTNPDGSIFIVPEESGYAPFEVSAEFVRKHQPQAGGYYVVYEDGYTSYSPAKPFEDGYTKITA